MRVAALVFVAGVLAGSACRGGKVDPFELANQRVSEGVSEGLDASSDVDAATMNVRYNPAPCECPDFEVYAYGRWMRAFVDGELPALDVLRSADSLEVTRVTGNFESKRRAAKDGVLYPVVVSRP